MRPCSIAIVGCGTAGLAAALFLSRSGHRVVLFERFPEPRAVGAGLLLQPTGLAVLDRLGLAAEARRFGARIDRLYGRVGPAGPVIFDLAYDCGRTGHGVGIHRHTLFRILWEAAKGEGIAVETGREIAALDRGAGGAVALVDSRGGRVGPFDLVVDASGARSRLRLAVTDAPPHPFAYGAVWGIVPDRGATPAMLEQRYRGCYHMLGILPVGRVAEGGPTLATVFWSLKPATHPAWAARGIGAFHADWRATWPEQAAIVEAFGSTGDLSLASYVQFTAPRLTGARIALVGDSGHSTSPQLGQGANMALLDAAALADSLDMASNMDAALEAYARRRHAHIRFYQTASAILTLFFQSDSRLAAGLRNATMHRLAAIPWLRNQMLATLAGVKAGPFRIAEAGALAGAQPSPVATGAPRATQSVKLPL